jgi:phage portal protein BeeE
MVGDNTKASRGTTEQENQEYLSYTLAPWINSHEQEFKRKLFPHPKVGRRPNNPFYVQFDVSGMIRPDSASRTAYYTAGRQWGWLSPNDVLAMEKANPIDQPWAEEHLQAVNMAVAETGEAPTPMGSNAPNEEKKSDEA